MKNALYKTIAVLFVILSFHFQLSSQEFMPFAHSNYAGISGIVLQPASIADSRYRFDMALTGANVIAGNNYVAFKRDALFNSSLWELDNFKDDYMFENLNGKDKSGILGVSVMLPSFMVNLSDNSALAFSTRLRGIINIDNITEDLAKLMYEDIDYDPLLRRELTNANFSMQANYWLETGITFGNVIINKEKQFLKGGVTLKYLQGIVSGYTYINDLSYRFDGSDTLSLFQSTVKYGLSSNFDEEGIKPLEMVSKPGLGFDIGFVYEYRPEISKHRYNMDGREGLLRPDQEKYLFRLGVALLDFGSIKYKKGYYSQDFKADVRDWNIGDIEINSIQDLNDTLRNRFNFNEDVSETYRMRLPTALSIQFDYNLGHNFFLNFSPYIALNKGNSIASKSHYYSTYTFAPRYDRKWFGAEIPLQVDEFGRFKAGISLRMGPLWIGSNGIISNTVASKIYDGDVYFMLKIPIFRSIARDKDKDGVSNRLDQCPDRKGPWLMQGCPDTDGDNITDANDECPDEKGPESLNGCPDRDNDGIADKNDACPDAPGLPQFNGCPDTDGDGITDAQDECPDIAGKAEFNGCPDRDNDGIPDKADKCPDVAGLAAYDGCPFNDMDKDGISDDQDECPSIPGPAEFKGCPDTDGDGIPDKSDLCPSIAGVPENKGCPPIKKEEIEIIKRAFSNLEFESGKSIIKAVSYPSLDELAALMISQEMWKVRLSGHTDNTGKPEKNMELSKNRTQAVKDYLISKGVKEFRIKAEWFGQTKPVADNNSAEGRQKNRRVEMEIIFE